MSEQLELFRTLEKDFNFELTPCEKNFADVRDIV